MSVRKDLGPPQHTMATVRSQTWWCLLVIPALESLGWEGFSFLLHLGGENLACLLGHHDTNEPQGWWKDWKGGKLLSKTQGRGVNGRDGLVVVLAAAWQ